MTSATGIHTVATELYLLDVQTRMPLKFGSETLTAVTCARVRMTVADAAGNTAEGWGETPLSVQWVWPSKASYAERHDALVEFCKVLAEAWAEPGVSGHPIEVGHEFITGPLATLLSMNNIVRDQYEVEPMPYLAALVCCSPFDIALHDAYGNLRGMDVYGTYNSNYMSRDLSAFLRPAPHTDVDFIGRYPDEFLTFPRPRSLPAWHLVGGKDPLDESDLTGDEPDDGYPVMLADWIRRDGLKCLKVKLRGDDAEWDYDRLVRVGTIGLNEGVESLSADFNCTVREPQYVNDVLDRLKSEHEDIWRMILYVEQPFPYDLEANPIDVRSVAERKPLFMDESAHDWRLVKLGRELGWTGVALKTCKTQTGALLSLCWARAHGMSLMVQDLTNPMLAQIPHVLLAAHAGTIKGVETNAMQFYPDASAPEAKVHPGLYTRRDGQVTLDTIGGPGFGYRLNEIARELPEPVASF
ncbi:MAG: enolase C-terminal domain-like protein [Phycisphaerae bacterium]